jgi:hypothetical protein
MILNRKFSRWSPAATSRVSTDAAGLQYARVDAIDLVDFSCDVTGTVPALPQLTAQPRARRSNELLIAALHHFNNGGSVSSVLEQCGLPADVAVRS